MDMTDLKPLPEALATMRCKSIIHKILIYRFRFSNPLRSRTDGSYDFVVADPDPQDAGNFSAHKKRMGGVFRKEAKPESSNKASNMAIAVGSAFPNVSVDHGFPPEKVNMPERLKGKKTILVGLPGAFTPT